jgi:membrane protein
VAKRTALEFQEDNLTDWAAALTYYAVLALFPGLIVLVAMLGLLGQFPDTFNALLDIVRQVGPASAVDTFAGPIESVIAEKQTAGALLGFGLITALWSASGYVGAFMRASNAIYEVEEGRPFWQLRPLQIAVTVAMVLLLTAVAIAVVVTGPLAEAVGNVVGLGTVAVTVWSIAKWPVLVLLVMTMFSVLYYVAPNVQPPRFRWFTVGGAVALLLWVLASGLFAAYVANFGAYNKTYGALGGVILFLTWLWISNLALLVGAELNSELERARELEAGLPAEEEIQLPFRQAPKGESDAQVEGESKAPAGR